MKLLVCPNCQTQVPDRARVCTGCGAEIVRGASRRERARMGMVFAVVAILISVVALRALETAHGSPVLPSPKSDGAFLIFFGLVGLLVVVYVIGKSVARVSRKSQVRFYRSYQHQ